MHYGEARGVPWDVKGFDGRFRSLEVNFCARPLFFIMLFVIKACTYDLKKFFVTDFVPLSRGLVLMQ